MDLEFVLDSIRMALKDCVITDATYSRPTRVNEEKSKETGWVYLESLGELNIKILFEEKKNA